MPARAIIPKKLVADPQKMARVLTNTLNAQALAIAVDFRVTVASWRDKPTFDIKSPNAWTRTIGTDDANYARLNAGTGPHIIRPRSGGVLVFRTPFRPKSRARYIGSNAGFSGGNTVFTRGPVRHPGTEPREWDTAIAEKWDKLLGPIFQRAIDAAVS